VKAVVLVGGEGTRLRPLTLTTPKQMLPIGDRPMLERVLGWLRGHGIDEVVLSLGYRPDAFRDAYPDGECAGVGMRYAVEPEPLDTAGAIRFAATEAGIDDPFVVVNGDVLTGLDVSELIELHHERGAEATISLTPVQDPSAFGVVPTADDGRVLAFIEKPPREEAPTNLINAGTYVLEPSVLDRIPGGRRVSIERETFPALVAAGRLYAMASDADWIDAGTPATYLAANLRYASKPDGSCSIGTGAVIKDSVIGASVTIGSNAVIESSVVMEGAAIAARAEVRNSIVGSGAKVGDGARLAALCVVGAGVCVDPGVELAGGRVPSQP
jgi:mannose-1-phosphate guanylyltransferase